MFKEFSKAAFLFVLEERTSNWRIKVQSNQVNYYDPMTPIRDQDDRCPLEAVAFALKDEFFPWDQAGPQLGFTDSETEAIACGADRFRDRVWRSALLRATGLPL